MRFEVRYPTGAAHEVELQGTVAVIGRDPSCELVLNDNKCSRRHAVVEAGPQGIAIRDAGSANGIYVNGAKVERASLTAGDEVRLGDIVLRVLPEDVPGTVVMGPDEMASIGAHAPGARPEAAPPKAGGPPAAKPATPTSPSMPAPPPPPPPAPPRPQKVEKPPDPKPRIPPPPPSRQRPTPRPSGGASGAPARPATVIALALLWALSSLLYVGIGGYLAFRSGDRLVAIAGGVTGGFLGLVSLVMAGGIWGRKPWARILQILIGAVGLLNCPFALSAIVVLFYLFRGATKIQFSGRLAELGPAELETASKDPGDIAYAAALLGTVLLGAVALTAGSFLYNRYERPPAELSSPAP